MDFHFFESLSVEDAQQYLERYLAVESEALNEMVRYASDEGVTVDFTVESVPAVLKWLLSEVHTVPRQPDESLPSWIRQSDSYERGSVDFDEPSKLLVMRASYYLGESFVRRFDSLCWDLGNTETLEGKMPVVTGFASDVEMATIMVTENLFHRVLKNSAKIEDIDHAVEHWRSLAE